MNAELGYNIAKQQIIDLLNENVFWNTETEEEYIKPSIIGVIEKLELNSKDKNEGK